MNSLFKINKNLTLILIFITIIPLFGFKFFISLVGNIFLLLILIPILIFLITLIGVNSFKSKLKTCEACGTLSLGFNNKCLNCGRDLETTYSENLEKASDTTIEVKAEEIN